MDGNVTNDVLYVPFTGKLLLESPLLNKGSSFTQQERHDFNLSGLLPCAIENIDEQAERAYQQYLEAESHTPGIFICVIFRIPTKRYFIIC